MRSRFDEELLMLNKELIEMGALCEDAIELVAKALETNDADIYKVVRPISVEIDHKERDIESRCMKLLLQQQPVARDLRQISAALKMITDMERIGDQAEDIAEIIGYLKGENLNSSVPVQEMARAAIKIVTESIDAYVNKDIVLAEAILKEDDIIDEYFMESKRRLIKMVAENPATGEYALDLLMITKYFERIGDHATNIAEWVIFSVTGEHEDA
ncbi:MAG: phosphate signaling complex protein PhoU [Lachnospiraceae bacterium]|nr:phosphate signaling complex protein PhoU [Lachnospiraceae bacterium]